MHRDFLNQKYQEAFKAALVKGAKLVGKYELPLSSLSTFIPKRERFLLTRRQQLPTESNGFISTQMIIDMNESGISLRDIY